MQYQFATADPAALTLGVMQLASRIEEHEVSGGGRVDVPFLDVGAAYRECAPEIDAAVRRTLDSGWYLLGNETKSFESAFARFTESSHCVGVANGLDALTLALRAMSLPPGAEVIVPSNTFIATWLAASYAGLTPVPVEPDPVTYTIDPARIETAVTSRTAAIIPVHLYGHPADMHPVMEVAARHGLRVLEDAAQAHGARYRGTRIGSIGDATTWSFYPGKNLGALGDGGAVTTDDEALAEKVRTLGNYGSRVKYQHTDLGVNSRLDELQAAALGAKLPRLDEWNERRMRIAARYSQELRGLGVGLPAVAEWAQPVWHLYVVRVPSARDEFQRELQRLGVGSVVHYPRSPHLQPAYASLGHVRGSFPIAEQMDAEVLSLPIGPHMSDRQVEHVVESVHRVCRAGA